LDPRDAIHVVGLTCEGEVPLLSTRSGSRETIALPGVALSGGDGAALGAVNRMLATLGYWAPELLTISGYGIPTRPSGRACILLAPRLTRSPARLVWTGLAIHEIPIARAGAWLRDRRENAAQVDPQVWVGLLLAQRHFPRWAEQRLRASLLELRQRGVRQRRVRGSAPRVPEERVRGA
jgi:hypothetical protein